MGEYEQANYNKVKERTTYFSDLHKSNEMTNKTRKRKKRKIIIKNSQRATTNEVIEKLESE